MKCIKKIERKIAKVLMLTFLLVTFFAPVSTTLQGGFETFGVSKVLADQGGQESMTKAASDAMNKPDFGCFDSFSSNSIPACLAAGGYYLFLVPTYWIAGWASIVLNFVLLRFVVGMGNVVRQLDGVVVAWGVLRDLADVFLVFITIYIGIATILGIAGYGYKKLLWRVLLAALLVNFSSTFTRGIIDISNIFALETYKMIIYDSSIGANSLKNGTVDCLTDTGAAPNDNDPCLRNGLASVFWSKLKITSIFNLTEMTKLAKKSDIYWNMLMTCLLGGIMFIVMTFVFGGAAFLLLGRVVLLTFLLIVSPVALVAWITGMSSQGTKWWHALLNQSMFAPLILLMWWISLRIATSIGDKFIPNNTSLATAASPASVTPIALASYFILIMGFLIISIVLAKQLGAYGASAVIKTSQNISRATGGFIAANTLGRASAYASRRYTRDMAKLQEVDENGNYKYGIRGRIANRLSGTAIDRGINKGLAAGSNMKFGGSSTFAESRMNNNKARDARKEDIKTQGTDAKIDKAVKTLNSRYVQDSANTYGDTEAQLKARQQVADAKKVLAGASTADLDRARLEHGRLLETDTTRQAFTKKQAIHLAGKASTSPMEKVQLKETAYKTEREALRGHKEAKEAWEAAVKNNANDPNNAVLKQKVDGYERIMRGMSVSDIEANEDLVRQYPESFAHVSPDTFEQIILNKNEKWSSEDLEKNKEARYAKLYEELAKGTSTQELTDVVQKLDNKDLAFVGSKAFSNEHFISSLKHKQHEHVTKKMWSHFNDSEKEFITTSRKKHFDNLLANPDKSALKKELSTMDAGTLAERDKEFLSNDAVIESMTPFLFDEMMKKGLVKEKQDAIRTAVEKKYSQQKFSQQGLNNLTSEQQNMVNLYNRLFNLPGRPTV